MITKGIFPALGLLASTLVIAAGVEFRAGDPGSIAAVFPPWWSQADILAAAASAGLVQGMGRTANVVLLRSDGSDLPARAASAGALFVLTGSDSTLCGDH